jgi:hypothetical protein
VHQIAVASLALAGVSTLVVVADILSGRRQRMWIMNLVWPLTAVWAGPLGLLAYWTIGRSGGVRPRGGQPRWRSIAIGSLHCGSGCTLGDVLAESFVTLVPVTLFGREIFGTWAIDYVFAFAFGIAFQYFAIRPMRHLSARAGLAAALKADALSLTSWQIGMYGWMALATFVLFPPGGLPKGEPVFWFMMQIAMGCGFVTSYPVNAWLIRKGIKEAM